MRRRAGLIPDSLWGKIVREWTKITKTPLSNVSTYDIESWVQSVGDRLEEFVHLPAARNLLQKHLGELKEVLGEMVRLGMDAKMSALRERINKMPEGLGKEILLSLRDKVNYGEIDPMLKGAKLFDALNYHWDVDTDKIVRDAKKLVDRYTGGDVWNYVYDHSNALYVTRKRRKKSGIREVEDRLKWIHDMLEANYSEEAIDRTNNFTEFDFHGVKVVVSREDLHARDRKSILRALDTSYQLLQVKGLTKQVWWGEVYLKCDGCGGVNYLTEGGVGGHYHIGPDTVSVYTKSAEGIPIVLLHELGHRYWFKGMTQAQRAKFERLVKSYKGPRPKAAPKLDRLSSILQGEVDSLSSILGKAQRIGDKFIEDSQDQTYERAATVWEDIIFYGSYALDTLLSFEESVFPIHFDASSTNSALMDLRLKSMDALGDENSKEFHATIERARNLLMDAFTKIFDLKSKKHQQVSEEREREVGEWRGTYSEDARSVDPVSDYGKYNVEEAFAEVFLHYVTNRDLNRDQLESFKEVLKRASTDAMAMRVAMEYVLVQHHTRS